MQGSTAPAGHLTLAQARESPCATCSTAPCCTHLPLHSFRVQTLRDLDHAIYLLNFERILLGLNRSGDWSVYYRYPCRFLDVASARCTVHATEQQPQICVHYSPYSCWYRQALLQDVSAEFLPIDRRRMQAIVERVTFDEGRNLQTTPSWAELMEQCAALPLDPAFDRAPEEDPVFEAWLTESAAAPLPPPAAGARRGYQDFLGACEGCAAPCCTTLVFPHGQPTSRRNLDYLQFALGFPGVEVSVSDQEWQLIIKTRCRHLGEDREARSAAVSDRRCSIYGQPERPLLCKYYDATSCSYVTRFGRTRPAGFLRLRLEQFAWMTEAIAFDADGAITQLPPTDALRLHVEERWREAVAAAAQV